MFTEKVLLDLFSKVNSRYILSYTRWKAAFTASPWVLLLSPTSVSDRVWSCGIFIFSSGMLENYFIKLSYYPAPEMVWWVGFVSFIKSIISIDYLFDWGTVVWNWFDTGGVG
jgi:hypothetical protein